MDEIRTLFRVAFVIAPKKGGAQRHITAWVDRLPDHPDDARRGLETFRLSIQDDDEVDEKVWPLPSISLLRSYLTDRLQKILGAVNYNTHMVEIIEDTDQLIQYQEARCQFCGKRFFDHYGDLGAVIKWCSRCKKFVKLVSSVKGTKAPADEFEAG